MSYADEALRPLLDLEGLKAWREGGTSGYTCSKTRSTPRLLRSEWWCHADDYRP